MKYVFNLFRPYFSRDCGTFVVIMHIVQHTYEEYVITIVHHNTYNKTIYYVN